jgi:hypothetical protein
MLRRGSGFCNRSRWGDVSDGCSLIVVSREDAALSSFGEVARIGLYGDGLSEGLAADGEADGVVAGLQTGLSALRTIPALTRRRILNG